MTPQASLLSDSIVKTIFENSKTGMLALGPSGVIRLANPAGARLFGYEPPELEGACLSQLLPGFSAPPLSANLPVKTRGRRRDQSEFTVEARFDLEAPWGPGVVFLTAGGAPLDLERDHFFDLSPDILCILAPDGRIQRVNPAAVACLGWSAEELQGRWNVEFVHPEDRASCVEGLKRLRSGQEVVPGLPVRCFAKDGSLRWLEWSTRPGGDEGTIYAAARDVTASVELKRRQQELVALIEHSRDLIGLATPDGSRILYLNGAGRRLLNLSETEELEGRSVRDFPVRNGPSLEEVQEALAAKGYWRGEVEYCGQAGAEPVVLDTHTFYVTDPASGQPIAWASVARDIRDQRRDQDRLRSLTAELLHAQEEERRRMARDLHDGPTQELSLLAADLEARAKLDPSGLLRGVRERVLAVAEEVRTLAHAFHPAVLEHAGLVAALDAYCQDASRYSGIPIHFAAPPELEVPSSIGVTLYRIAQEALHNVAKHARASTAVVSLMASGSTLRLTVMDDGQGFALDQVRLGSGLGLVSIEERARLMQGTVRITSVPGEGTRIEVEVPLTGI